MGILEVLGRVRFPHLQKLSEVLSFRFRIFDCPRIPPIYLHTVLQLAPYYIDKGPGPVG